MADSTETMTQDGAASAGHKSLLLKTYCISSSHEAKLLFPAATLTCADVPLSSISMGTVKESYQKRTVHTLHQPRRCLAVSRSFLRFYSWKTE